jgi:hypothetical protein
MATFGLNKYELSELSFFRETQKKQEVVQHKRLSPHFATSKKSQRSLYAKVDRKSSAIVLHLQQS